jgi:hypothetical protein
MAVRRCHYHHQRWTYATATGVLSGGGSLYQLLPSVGFRRFAGAFLRVHRLSFSSLPLVLLRLCRLPLPLGPCVGWLLACLAGTDSA